MQENLKNVSNNIIKLNLKNFTFRRTAPANTNSVDEKHSVPTIMVEQKTSLPKSSLTKKKKDEDEEEKGDFKNGRWEYDEHKRFIEAIIKFGNDWKSVQKHIGTRSSAQARSHAQKFFMKLKRSTILEKDFDFTKNSIRSLKDLIGKMNTDQYLKTIKALNLIVFDKKSKRVLTRLRKNQKNILNLNEGGSYSIKISPGSQAPFVPAKEVEFLPKPKELLSLSSSENNCSTQVKHDEPDNCFQLGFLNSFSSSLKREEYILNEDEDNSGILLRRFSGGEMMCERGSERKLSIDSASCLQFQD